MSPQPMSPHLTFANLVFVFLCLFVANAFARGRNRASDDRVWMERCRVFRRSCRGASRSARARQESAGARLLLTIQSSMELPLPEQSPPHHPLLRAQHSLTQALAQPVASLRAEAQKMPDAGPNRDNALTDAASTATGAITRHRCRAVPIGI